MNTEIIINVANRKVKKLTKRMQDKIDYFDKRIKEFEHGKADAFTFVNKIYHRNMLARIIYKLSLIHI